MSSQPGFLPALIDTSNFKSDADSVVEELYGCFQDELLNGSIVFRRVPVVLDRLNIMDGRENLFWHLIQNSQSHGSDGVLDHDKARRFRWIKAVIENEADSEVTVFNHKAPDKPVRTYLWVKEEHYVVILEFKRQSSKGPNFSLVTSYYMDFERERKRMQRKYDNRIIY